VLYEIERANHPVVSRHAPLGGPLKRSFDIVASFALLLALLPEMLLVALAVKLTSVGPALFLHRRIGVGGQEFACIKFRSMVADAAASLPEHLAQNPTACAEWSAMQKLRSDPRVTPIGRFLRRWSIDELPQLLNVLRGEMSLVGPRPITAEELHRYGSSCSLYLSARPGITGLWQVSGRSGVSYVDRVRLDLQYIDSWSPVLDACLLLKTLTVVATAEGAR
jgi:exopolysaccharide production protein ExoY